MHDLLKKLTEASGVSGAEKEVRLLIRDEIQEHVDKWHVDALGNLIAFKKGAQSSDFSILLDAHMDEVGLLITSTDSNGTYQFEKVGGVDSRGLVGSVVQVGAKKLSGVIGVKPIHHTTSAERAKLVPIKSMRIDIGATSKEGANGKAKLGDRATFLTAYEELGDVALGKAFDDRVGCALIIELLKKERYPFDLYAAFTVQEEVGLRGANTVAYAIQPDMALVLDCTPAYDLPNEADESPNVRLGSGPALYVMDRATIQDPRLVQFLMRTASAHALPYQIRRPGGGGTNTASVQRAGAGVASATLSLPARYLHTATSMINLNDYQAMLSLLDHALRELTPDVIRR